MAEPKADFLKAVCDRCKHKFEESDLIKTNAGLGDGPAPERQALGLLFEMCHVCDIGTVSGVYLKEKVK